MPRSQQDMGDSRPVRIPLATTLGNRAHSSTTDGRLVNAYAEKVGEDLWVYKRPTLKLFSSLGANAAGRGVFNWLGDIYAVWDGALYKNNVSVGAVAATGGIYTFSSTLGGTPRLFLHNTTNGYRYDAAGGLVAVAGGLPASLVPGQAYLDATTYVVTPGATVQGSGLNDLTTWPALNNLIAQIEPDQAVAVAKQLVYVVVFKQWSTEMFYDAGNATGSPLGAVQGQKLNVGCVNAGTVADMSGTLLWVSQIRNGGMSVMLMDQLSAQPISSPNVERLLQTADFTGAVYAWAAKIDGHLFYGLSIANSNLTLVYDLKQQLWSEWTDANGNYFPITSSTFSGTSSIMQHASNGKLYTLDPLGGTDDGALVTTDIFTPPYDAGSRYKKTIGRLRFIGDQTPGNVLQLRVSDDDYKTFSNFRMVDMNITDPYLSACGSFKKRVFHIRQATATGGRLLMALEPELEMGEA